MGTRRSKWEKVPSGSKSHFERRLESANAKESRRPGTLSGPQVTLGGTLHINKPDLWVFDSESWMMDEMAEYKKEKFPNISKDAVHAFLYAFDRSMSPQGEREFLIRKLEDEIATQEANLARSKRNLVDLKTRGTGRTTSLVKDITNPHTLFLVHNRAMINIVADMAQEYLPQEVFDTLQILNICDESDDIAERILQSRLRTLPIIVDHAVWEFAITRRNRLLPMIKYFQGIANKGRAE